MARKATIKSRIAGINGEAGLLISVLAMATDDFRRGGKWGEDAKLFFRSDWYKHILGVLDLPPDWLPAIVENAGISH